MKSIPFFPASKASHVSSTVFPMGVTAPIPNHDSLSFTSPNRVDIDYLAGNVFGSFTA